MRNYKLKFIDRLDVAVLARDFEGLDDLEALAAAEKACATHDVEVWQGTRRVARVKKGNAALDAEDHQSL